MSPSAFDCGALRAVLSDCGDGIPVLVNGRPIISSQIRLVGTANTLELLTDPTAQPQGDGDAGAEQLELDTPPITEEEIMDGAPDIADADLPPLTDDATPSDDPDGR